MEALSAAFVNHGNGVAIRAFNLRDLSGLQAILDDSSAADKTTRNAGRAALYGATVGLTLILGRVADLGLVKFTGATLPTQDELFYAFNCADTRFSESLQRILSTANQVFAVLPPGVKASAPAPQTSAIEAPQPVTVISMPVRRTTSTVSRDSNGDIAGTEQIEADIFSEPTP